MAAVRHLEYLRQAYIKHSALCEPIFQAHAKLGEDVLIGAGDMPPKRNSK